MFWCTVRCSWPVSHAPQHICLCSPFFFFKYSCAVHAVPWQHVGASAGAPWSCQSWRSRFESEVPLSWKPSSDCASSPPPPTIHHINGFKDKAGYDTKYRVVKLKKRDRKIYLRFRLKLSNQRKPCCKGDKFGQEAARQVQDTCNHINLACGRHERE